LSRHKLFSFINIFGLAMSMSVCMIVLIGIKDQTSYDHFHPNSERTFRVVTELTSKEGSGFRFASSPLPLASELTRNPFVQATTRLYQMGSDMAIAGKKELAINGSFAEPSFFKVFGFSLHAGDARKALAEPNSIVLSKTTAEKFFGEADPVGQTMQLARFGNFQVTGVLDLPKGKSHIDFESYLSMSSLPGLERTGKFAPVIESWDPKMPAYTYVHLKAGTARKQLDQALTQIAARLLKTTTLQGKENLEFETQPFDKIILGEELQNSFGNVGSMEKTLGSLFIAFIVLLSACFNYTNLSIARSLKRGKEVGVRKVAGAFRYQVFYQFILESVLLAFLALGLALLFLQLIKEYAPFAGEVGLDYDGSITSWFLLFALFTGLLAGALPAWVLSSFKPVEVLKNLSNIRLLGGNRFRNGLIIVQFVLALVTIIFTSVSSRQFNYIASAEPGYTRENLLVLPTESTDSRLLSTEIKRLGGVVDVTATSQPFGRNTSGRVSLKKQPAGESFQMDHYDVDGNFADVMGLNLLAGTFFVPNAPAGNESTAVINEKALHLLGYKQAGDAVGKVAWIDDTTKVQIAGVVADFHFLTVAVQLGPLVLLNRPAQFNFLLVKTASRDSALVAQLEKVWKKNSGQPFKSSWLKEDQQERQAAWGTVSMLGFLAIMTITIACMGLLGMVIYNTETRRKEIGIRKVMGASVTTIMQLLSWSFLKLVLIAGLIALPVGYVVGYLFLQIFANHISIGPGTLVCSFTGLLILALITIGSQVFKVASANPVNSLRNE
jgi:putative ABC transport system permease protein